jgi:excisionase family DNA binding protein
MKGESNVTLLEACKLLKKSKRTVSRYIKKGLLNPEINGNEYKFNRSDLLKFKKTKRTKKTNKTKPESDIISFLKEQIKEKDEQINKLLERSRETNIMFNRLQNQLLLTGNKEEGKKDKEDKEDRQDKKEKGLNGFFKKLFNR